MDDMLGLLLVLFSLVIAFVGLPFLFVLSIMSCIAWGKTRKWQKEKEKHLASDGSDLEMDRLVSDDEEEEPLDSEDEAEIAARKEAEKPDWDLTSWQKFRKELKKTFEGNDAAVKQKAKENEAKFARQVAREMLRVERRRERRMKKAHGSKAEEAKEDQVIESEPGLPTYDVATASSSRAE